MDKTRLCDNSRQSYELAPFILILLNKLLYVNRSEEAPVGSMLAVAGYRVYRVHRVALGQRDVTVVKGYQEESGSRANWGKGKRWSNWTTRRKR